MRENLKQARKAVTLSEASTKELMEELCKRDGVEKTIAEPYQEKQIRINGPAIVLMIID